MAGQQAREPEDLARLFVERANAGDLDGLVALYEPSAVLAFPPGQTSVGTEQIRRAYADFLATKPVLAAGEQAPALRSGEYALTSTRLPSGGATAEVAHRQPDGTWRWIVDQPAVVPT
jgi:ketosteroid isomerase-like protein